jgi:hypothetical protein
MVWVLRNRVGPAELTDRRCDVGDLSRLCVRGLVILGISRSTTRELVGWKSRLYTSPGLSRCQGLE